MTVIDGYFHEFASDEDVPKVAGKNEFCLKAHALFVMQPSGQADDVPKEHQFDFSQKWVQDSTISPLVVLSRNSFVGIKEKGEKTFDALCKYCTKPMRPRCAYDGHEKYCTGTAQHGRADFRLGDLEAAPKGSDNKYWANFEEIFMRGEIPKPLSQPKISSAGKEPPH